MMRKSKMRAMYAALLLAAAAASLSGCTPTVQVPDTIKVQSVDGAADVITATGLEEVKVVPDMAQIEYAIRTQADTASQCQSDNAEKLKQALETLKSLGINEASIQTSAYGLNPIYDWNSSTQEITGYEMNTQITVSDIPIDNAGSILSQSVAAGVNQIEAVRYFSSKYDESYQEALKGAIDMAKKKAEAMAAASERTVTGVAHVEEYGYNPYARYSGSSNTYGAGAAKESMAAAMDMSVMPGQVSVEAQVTVTFNIQ